MNGLLRYPALLLRAMGVLLLCFLFGLSAVEVTAQETTVSLTPAQDAFLDAVAQRTWTEIKTSALQHLPRSWRIRTGAAISGGDYVNPTEIGLYLLSYLGAYELRKPWSPTRPQLEAELNAVLTQLRTWQTSSDSYLNTVFYQVYLLWITPPAAGGSDYERIVPSIDNAFLAASLLTVREWADFNGSQGIRDTAAAILADMDFMLWYNNTTNQFQLGDTNQPMGGGPADLYSNENRLINVVARALGQMSTQEFRDSLAALGKPSGSYSGITVPIVNWFGSYFTYAAPGLFLRETETDYRQTINAATNAQIAYAQNEGYTAWGFSDAYDVGSSMSSYVRSGALPAAMPIPPNDIEIRDGLVTPHASALALNSDLAPAAVSNLQYLAAFPQLYSPLYGYKDSFAANPADSLTYRTTAAGWSALAQQYILLAIAEQKTGFIWRYFYRNPEVQRAHQEMHLDMAGCNLGMSNPLTSLTDDLDHSALDWGGFCDNGRRPIWSKFNITIPITEPGDDGLILRCAMDNVLDDAPPPTQNEALHCYRNLNPQNNAVMFTMDMDFRFSETSCNNANGVDSVVQGLEFSMGKWINGKRYEFALQYENVRIDGTPGLPRWRYWDGIVPGSVHADVWELLDTPVQQCLESGMDNWHHFRLEGAIVNDQAQYRSFTIDGQEHLLSQSVPPCTHQSCAAEDKLAVAVQLDATNDFNPYVMDIDEVSFVRWNGLITPLLPADNATVTNGQPIFTWSPLVGAVQYDFEWWRDDVPREPIIRTAATSFRPTCGSLPEGTYRWRVRGIDALGHESPWSQPRTLIIQLPQTAAPIRNYYTTTPTLAWQRVAWARGYQIQVDALPTFNGPRLYSDDTLPATTLSVTPMLAAGDGSFCWRVRAKQSNNTWGPWSAVDTFFLDS
ncbi:MAG: hypothetical protein JNJ61_13445 [Anaerolineae bacterium]|nr:hypothetical protein [Anaerolineae bacterium]